MGYYAGLLRRHDEEENYMNIKLDLDNNPTLTDIDVIQKGINHFNSEKVGESPKEFCIYLRDDSNTIQGGIFAVSYSDSIHIILMWMDEKLRSKGFGTKLIKAAEEEGIKRKCAYSYVDTFSFQAEGFYRKCGYQPIGNINNALFDYSRVFLKKPLAMATKSESTFRIKHVEPATAKRICREIASDLPEYFGIPEANERYANGMLERVTFAAKDNDNYIGLLALEFPFNNNANIYWMAVKRASHGKGVGLSLMREAENYCRDKGYQSITVETLSPKNCDKNYLKTYQFYEKSGFQPLFELNTYGTDFLMVYMQKMI
jgi:GNAT superfamily N-acetyltransferase